LSLSEATKHKHITVTPTNPPIINPIRNPTIVKFVCMLPSRDYTSFTSSLKCCGRLKVAEPIAIVTSCSPKLFVLAACDGSHHYCTEGCCEGEKYN
jgi:hypothetical protein